MRGGAEQRSTESDAIDEVSAVVGDLVSAGNVPGADIVGLEWLNAGGWLAGSRKAVDEVKLHDLIVMIQKGVKLLEVQQFITTKVDGVVLQAPS